MLAQRSGNDSDTGAVAGAAVITWNQMAAELVPVIGVRGVDVLFNRALNLTSATFPWLTTVREHVDGAARLSDFRAHLEGQEAAVAVDAASALLAKFIELLSALIGEGLTERLLMPVWAARPPVPNAEDKPS
jgi:hypothetical protein